MTPINVDEALASIVAALRQLRPPEWTRHKDFAEESLTWWVDRMHPDWMAEQYLEYISPDRAPLKRRDKESVKKIGLQAKELADNMKRCRAMEFVDRFHQSSRDDIFDKPMPTFAAVQRALDKLAVAASEIEYGNAGRSREVAVANIAASHFARITWRDPGVINDKIDGKTKASGPFLDLVKAIFEALNITSNAERSAKGAAAEFKKPKDHLEFPHANRLLPMDADLAKLDE